MALEIMGETFSRRRKVLVNDTTWRSDDSTSTWQLGSDFVNSPVGDVLFSVFGLSVLLK